MSAEAPARRADAGTILEVEGISKRFGGLVALSEVHFAIAAARSTASSAPTARARPRSSTCSRASTARTRQHPLRRRAPRRADARPHRRAGHRAHVPEHPALRQPLGARERDGRPARAHPRRRRGRDPAQRGAPAPRKRRSSAARASSSPTSGSRSAATSSPDTSPTATSAASRSRARSRPSRGCSPWTSPPPA